MLCPEDLDLICYIGDYPRIFQMLAVALFMATLVGTLAGAFSRFLKARKGH